MNELKKENIDSENEKSMLYFRDDLRKIWLYQANCLELMDG
jgi:hypothetical protein